MLIVRRDAMYLRTAQGKTKLRGEIHQLLKDSPPFSHYEKITTLGTNGQAS
ncbi:hypothetical protein J4421_00130 [Candidatus Woesearchaeota archaeon]|nr:hypothetical protein [Candidatus Woesearchaeota archaeon]